METGTISQFEPKAVSRTIGETKRLKAEARKLQAKLREGREALTLTRELCRYGLRAGLTLSTVRRRLHGWSDHPIWVSDSREGFCCATWDFTPPGTDIPRLRLTFFDDRLIAWGAPAKSR